MISYFNKIKLVLSNSENKGSTYPSISARVAFAALYGRSI